ncbi:MAG: Tol-Pal system beta propeller repeat protein TolB [candidate division WOR-3 bacterium]
MGRRIILSLFILFAFAFGQKGSLEVWAKITSRATKKQLPIAIAEFTHPKEISLSLKEMADNLRKVLIADLDFSLYFRILSSKDNYNAEEGKIEFSRWQQTGAKVLICPDLFTKRGVVNIRIRVYDLELRKKLKDFNYGYFGDWRWLAHTIADDLIKLLTGEEGVCRTKIVFSYKKGKGKELALIDYDGANFIPLTNDGGLKLYPEWSPNNEEIAYSSYSGSNLNLYAYNLKMRRSRLISASSGLNTTPAYSPDGKHIACAITAERSLDLYLITGDKKNRITYGHSIDISPSFSPSGQQLAFCSDRSGSPQIYLINVDGTNLYRLTTFGSYNTSPCWSPKGDLIAYTGRTGEGRNQIFITDITGSFFRQLTFEGNNEEPSFSPDGLHIVFASNRTGSWEIWVMHWDGSGQKQLTNLGGAFSPSWSKRFR